MRLLLPLLLLAGCAARSVPPSVLPDAGDGPACGWTLTAEADAERWRIDLACAGLPPGWQLVDLPGVAWPRLRGQEGAGPPMVAAWLGEAQALERGAGTWAVQVEESGELRLAWATPDPAQAAEALQRFRGGTTVLPYVAPDHGFLRMDRALLVPRVAGLRVDGVRFVLPKGWGAHAPWPRGDESWTPASLPDLLDNYVLVGRTSSVDREVGPQRRVEVAVVDGHGADADGLGRSLQPPLEQAARWFSVDDFLFVVRPRWLADDLEGTAGRASAQGLIGDEPAALAEVLLHEYVHAWLPGGLSEAERRAHRAAWFDEGFTTWATLRFLGASGQLSAEEGLARILRIDAMVAGLDRQLEQPPTLGELRTLEGRPAAERGLAYQGGAQLAGVLDLQAGGTAFFAALQRLVEQRDVQRTSPAFADALASAGVAEADVQFWMATLASNQRPSLRDALLAGGYVDAAGAPTEAFRTWWAMPSGSSRTDSSPASAQ